MQEMLQRALHAPQTMQQAAPMRPEFMGEPEQMADPVREIQDQLDAVVEEMQQTEDPGMLRNLAGVARELQLALETALQRGV